MACRTSAGAAAATCFSRSTSKRRATCPGRSGSCSMSSPPSAARTAARALAPGSAGRDGRRDPCREVESARGVVGGRPRLQLSGTDRGDRRDDPTTTEEGGGSPRGGRLARASTQVKILVPGDQSMVALLGQRDELLKLIEAAFDSQIVVRGNEITISGPEEEAERVGVLFEELISLLERGHELTAGSVGRSIEMIKGDEARPTQVLTDVVLGAGRGRGIAPKTVGQKQYVDAMRRSTVTFAIGPAGTGKTYLAVATAVKALQDKQVQRLILTRPAVEAGERLGFLPGTLYEKIDPYMKPLYDALFEMTGADTLPRLMERGTVEVAPLAFMRGRTLNSSFVILDEAQNTTPEQMKMFLTRLGFNSKAVVNGDVTQIDLPNGQRSGLVQIQGILRDIDGIEFCDLGARDVVRHRIVQDIVEAYRVHGERTEDGRS